MDSYLVLAASLTRDVDQARLVSMNVANSATPGFKRWLVNEADMVAANLPASGREMAAGKMLVSGRSLDIYLPDGVFLALDGSGSGLFSRGGRLRVDAHGQLVTAEGVAVRVEGSAAPLTQDVVIARDGRLFSESREVGRLALVQGTVDSQAAEGVYRLRNAEDIQPGGVVIEPGAYEAANVNMTDEMVTMLKSVRHMESVQRVLKQQDALHEKLFNSLARF